MTSSELGLVLSSEKGKNGTKQRGNNLVLFEQWKRKKEKGNQIPFDFIPFDLILPANLI